MAAAYLARFLPRLQLTVIEAPDVPPLVVGESTNSISRRFNHALGLDEASFLRSVNGTYKIAIRFEGFSALGHTFHHPFGRPVSDVRCAPAADEQYRTTHLCRAGRVDPAAGVHGYHVDAGRYSVALRELAMSRGVKRIERRIDRVDVRSDRILSVEGHQADLYIDCTGFRALLIGQALREPFEPLDHVLLNDAAVAMQVPYRDRERQMIPVTRCTALRHGWVWTIPLWSRLGIGYCYSSRFVDGDAAERELRAFLGEAHVADIKATHIRIRHGRHRRQWVGNCVALGPAAGFIEPLESTGIALTQRNVIDLTVRLNDLARWGQAANRRFDTTVDFIQAHYALTRRQDTPYWSAARALPRTAGLERVLEGAAAGSYAVIDDDPDAFYRAVNWNVILSGMGVFDQNRTAARPGVPLDMGTQAQGHHAYLREHVYRQDVP
jgi:tryptophan halogenase